MKYLPFISTVSDLNYGHAMQIRSGQSVVADIITHPSYETMVQYVFKGINDKVVVAYIGLTELRHHIYVNLTSEYKIVKNHYNSISKIEANMPKVAEALKEESKNGPFPLFFTCEDNQILLTKHLPAFMFDDMSPDENLFVTVYGMIRTFTRELLESIYNSNVLTPPESKQIYESISIVKQLMQKLG